MTDRTRQNWSIASAFTIAVALMGIGAGIWNLSAGFTTATTQHEQLFKQNAQIFQQNAELYQMVKQNADEQLKILRQIEERLSERSNRSRR